MFSDIDETEVDTTEAEVEVTCLKNLMLALRPHGVEAVFILGPDINCSEHRKRTLRTMHPWNLYSIAKALASIDAHSACIEGSTGGAPRWSSIRNTSMAITHWGASLSERGFATVLAVPIPIAMGRQFDCILVSRLENHAPESSGLVALETLAYWPQIKREIAANQQILTHQEQKVLHLSALGATSNEAAKRCDTTERMVNFHIGNSLRKLKAQNKTAAVLKAIMMGVL